jgi:dienelactone hydrolase
MRIAAVFVLAVSIAAAAPAAVPVGASPVGESGKVRVEDLTFTDADGASRAAYLVSPAGGKPTAGVLFLLWLGEPPNNDRTEFLADARMLAEHGVTSLLVNEPWSNESWFEQRKLENDLTFSHAEVKTLGLALDLLSSRLPRKAKKKIALVGHDFGAMYGSLLAGEDSRIRAAVLMAATPHFSTWFLIGQKLGPEARAAYEQQTASLDAAASLRRRSQFPVLFQFAKKDRYIPEKAAKEFFDAANEPKRLLWYDATHRLADPQAQVDRLAWLEQWLVKP